MTELEMKLRPSFILTYRFAALEKIKKKKKKCSEIIQTEKNVLFLNE